MNLDAALEMFARRPEAPLDVAEVALCLARDEYPQLDVEACLGEIAGMAHEVKTYLRGDLPACAHGLCRYLFHEMGFRGNQREYYDPANSYLNMVLERRTGIPISLSVLALAVGRRAGLEMAGIGLPGHFVVKLLGADTQVILDPFHGGRVLSLSDCEILVQQTTGKEFAAGAHNLQPLPLGLLVQRMLNNLRGIYLGKQDFGRGARVLERLRQLNPDEATLRRDLGICYLGLGQPGKAIGHLRTYLQSEPEPDDADGMRTVLRDAERLVAEWN